MDTFKSFEEQLYPSNEKSFEDTALSLFRLQAKNNPIYRDFLENLGTRVNDVTTLSRVPFLPISLFKTHTIKTGTWDAQTIFQSSGTSGAQNSLHYVKNIDFYLNHAVRCFEEFFGPIEGFHFLALLPSYLEQRDSSLIRMLKYFIHRSKSLHSGFYLYNRKELISKVEDLRSDTRKIVVWGVSFALLDLGEEFCPDLSDCLVIETGGMKGRRAELTRQELHEKLRNLLGVREIYSEYGMTELFSQAYSKGGDTFFCPRSLEILIRDVTDPFSIKSDGVGAINVIDLANIYSVSFIETEDLGERSGKGFKVLGRLDNSDVRGCNLLV